jgi:hypothetical protein
VDTQRTLYMQEQVAAHHKLPPLLMPSSVRRICDISHPATSIYVYLEEESCQIFQLIMMRLSNAHFIGPLSN